VKEDYIWKTLAEENLKKLPQHLFTAVAQTDNEETRDLLQLQ
jgi:hypothetical protein